MDIKRERGGTVAVALEAHELVVVRQAFGELDAMLAGRAEPGEPAAEVVPGVPDPFADQTTREHPQDPAMARLLPDAYRDDPDATAEFRRFTEADLLAGKRANIATLLDTLGDGERPARLDQTQLRSWLYAINDLRLTLGTRLGIEEDYVETFGALPPEDPRLPALYLYEWLSALQDGLIRVAK